MISSFQELHQLVQGAEPKTVALVAAEDPILIRAAGRAQKEGLAKFILVGDRRKIQSLIPPDEPSFEVKDSQHPAQDGIQLINKGQANLLMKGKLQTSDLLRAVLNKETGLRQGELLNHISVVESQNYHKLVFISDGGLNLHLDENVFIQMAHNIAAYLRKLDILTPRFGMMALVENVTDKIPETVIAERVARRLAATYKIEGPIAPDVALSAAAALQKGLSSEIAGDVDVFLMPNTTAANHMVKGLYTLGGCKIGGVIVGAKVPIILLSRSDDADSKYRSILLGLV